MRHYIAMSGQHGCLPDSCEVYTDKRTAISDIKDLYPEKNVATILTMRGIVELGRNRYASVEACECATPGVHSDSGVMFG